MKDKNDKTEINAFDYSTLKTETIDGIKILHGDSKLHDNLLFGFCANMEDYDIAYKAMSLYFLEKEMQYAFCDSEQDYKQQIDALITYAKDEGIPTLIIHYLYMQM